MSNINWEKFGEEISKTVQSAVENQNFERLNQMIKEKLNYSGYKTYTTNREKTRGTSFPKYENTALEIQTKVPSKTVSVVLAVAGFTVGAANFFGCLLFLAATIFIGDIGAAIVGLIFILLTGAVSATGFTVGVKSRKKVSRIGRFHTYLSAIGQKEYCNISELAQKSGETVRTIQKDLEYMISKRWFLQGHLDKQKTCLMVTNKMYDQYCQLEQRKEVQQKEAKEREEQKRKLQEEQIAAGKMLPPEVQKVIEKGDEYIRKIRKCNDDIPGEEISAKIYRIEMLVDKIFDRVEQNPKSVSDIRKLMDYYLPTTVKLLEAYADLDAQPTKGENIQTAKQEIEQTLDTLNVAFEKLLDSLFQETAWDVSSDISVLNTMLAQEGLKDDGLKRK